MMTVRNYDCEGDWDQILKSIIRTYLGRCLQQFRPKKKKTHNQNKELYEDKNKLLVTLLRD